jgi:hypothetical protein
MIYQIICKGLTFGIEAKRKKVTAIAPCAKWQMGNAIDEVLNYWRGRGAKVISVGR